MTIEEVLMEKLNHRFRRVLIFILLVIATLIASVGVEESSRAQIVGWPQPVWSCYGYSARTGKYYWCTYVGVVGDGRGCGPDFVTEYCQLVYN